jgi:hypothetical protein
MHINHPAVLRALATQHADDLARTAGRSRHDAAPRRRFLRRATPAP